MAMPKKAQINKVLKEIEKREKDGEKVGTKIEIDLETLSGVFKYNLCKNIIRIKREKGLKNSELATLMGVDEAISSRITHYRVSKISLDKILIYLEALLNNLGLKGSIKEFNSAFESISDIKLKKRA